MARVGIYGATGYTGIELINVLSRHPGVEIGFATARSAAGQLLSEVFPIISDLRLAAVDEVDPATVDLVFTCLPHNTPELIPIVQRALAAGAKVVDFSDTFRISDPQVYAARRGKDIRRQSCLPRRCTGCQSYTVSGFGRRGWLPIPVVTR
jgi:Acetylglutamate semialdehyde dehydrogenase